MVQSLDKKRKICVVTGSRADYGLLYYFMVEVERHPAFDLQLVVTGMHLSPEFGMTVEKIEEDGFEISARVETLLSSDHAVGIAKSTGLGVIGFADAFQNLQPDLIMLLGDRFEIFAAAQAALFLKIPVGHIGGGDVTVGAFDEAMRHSISKMSHLHFATNEEAVKRLQYMGEDPTHIFNVGSPGLDFIKRAEIIGKDDLATKLGFEFGKRNFLVTFHPVTLNNVSSEDQLNELLKALDLLDQHDEIIITLPNADTGGRAIIELLNRYAQTRSNVHVFSSLGQERYWGCLKHMDVVIGNSSSGLYEAPSFKIPTVNIGNRQEGRLRARSVFNCQAETGDIYKAIMAALEFGKQEVLNPYKQGDCAQLMMQEIAKIENYDHLVMKHFYDVPTQ
ncbi:MAG: UDP-N-acetylglucosamine 2-epimerase (hydrolyzing) [Methylocystaceae bacterium]|nr:UDP-N-acetylglucosamine 2-epimerase (hydrolyzing) [Methylocystaceae bacterium]